MVDAEKIRKELGKTWEKGNVEDFNEGLAWSKNYPKCICSECEQKYQGWLDVGREINKSCIGFYEKIVKEAELHREAIRQGRKLNSRV